MELEVAERLGLLTEEQKVRRATIDSAASARDSARSARHSAIAAWLAALAAVGSLVGTLYALCRK